MSLSDRLRKAAEADKSLGGKEKTRVSVDPFQLIKERAQASLLTRLGTKLVDKQVSEAELRKLVMAELDEILAGEEIPLNASERKLLGDSVVVEFLGYGPMQQFLTDDSVTEIMVNGTKRIYVERDGKLQETEVQFLTEDHLRRVIGRIVARVGRRIDESSPMVDARLPDGSRVNAIVPPLAVDSPSLTIRKFAREAFTADDLVEMGSISQEAADFLQTCVLGKRNILISGGTGSGKTTLLNVMSGFIPADERIVTIEDSVELQLAQEHVVRLESRPPNIEQKGEVTIRDLVRNSLRMRPDRIIVGEVRSGEALDMMQAMNTGHEGSLSTIHSNSPRDAVSRLETMVLMSGVGLNIRAIREQIGSALDLIIQIQRRRDGSRGIAQISEVTGLEGDIITMQHLFEYRYGTGKDGELGELGATGIRPQFAQSMEEYGFVFPSELFSPPGRSGRR